MASEMLTALSNLFVERIPTGVEDKLPSIDGAYTRLVKPSTQNVKYDSFTNGWKAYDSFVASVGGAQRFDQNPHGPDMQDNTNVTQLLESRDTFPGFDDVVMPDYGRYSITIANVSGNVALDLRMFRNQKLNDTIDDYPSRVLKSSAHCMAHTAALCWYLDSSGRVILLDTKSATASAVRTGKSVAVTNTAGIIPTGATQMGRRRRIMPGMQFDIWKSDMTACYTQNGWAILDSYVDYLYGTTLTFRFKSEADAVLFASKCGSGGEDTVLVPYTAVAKTSVTTGNSRLPIGYQQWILSSGTLFGNFGDLTVENYGTMFRSITAAVSGTLTNLTLNKYIDAFVEANGDQLDTILMSNGVYQEFIDYYGTADPGSLGVLSINRDESAAQKTALGYAEDALMYQYNGKKYRIETSHFVAPGEVVIMKARNGNLVRYQPPKIGKMDASVEGGRYEWDPSIEWLGQYWGDTIWMPSSTAGGGKSTGMEAPYMMVTQNGAREPRGIRLTACTEETFIGTDI